MPTSSGVRSLRAKVRGFQAEGMSLHRKIKTSSGPKKNEWWVNKRTLGKSSRSHLIAYGLLRWRSYERIEQKSTTLIDIHELTSVLAQHVDYYDLSLFRDTKITYPENESHLVTKILVNYDSDRCIEKLISNFRIKSDATAAREITSAISTLKIFNQHVNHSPIITLLTFKINEYLVKNNITDIDLSKHETMKYVLKSKVIDTRNVDIKAETTTTKSQGVVSSILKFMSND